MRGTLEERFWAKVDKSGECWEWTAGKTAAGYGTFYAEGKQKYAHRVSFEFLSGQIPGGLYVDHICHYHACVKPSYLRLATHKQNMEHRAGPPSHSTSGVLGVTWHRAARKWKARVYHHGKGHYVGLFSDIADAEAAVIAKRNELYTHNDLDRRAA